MTLPIVAYGNTVLREKCRNIDQNYPGLNRLIEDMWETLYAADGCGLAAPQINQPIRLFLVDSVETYESMDEDEQAEYFPEGNVIQETFINARITERSKETWTDQEGCLSIPRLVEDVERPWSITIEYLDRNFEKKVKTFSGTTARMIQHEYDHTEGILYLDHLPPSRRTLLLKNKLKKISEGQVKVKYKMKFVK